jgi:PleD family two-component response regulator
MAAGLDPDFANQIRASKFSMRLPCVLLIEPEMPEGVSARKLVLETSKINVISAYTSESALANFSAFANVDAVIVHVGMREAPYTEVVRQIRAEKPNMRIAVLSAGEQRGKVEGNDAVVNIFDPTGLLNLIQQWFDTAEFEGSGFELYRGQREQSRLQ